MGISNAGEPSVAKFCELLEAEKLKRSDPNGDVFVSSNVVDGHVEIKYCGAATINQVRPLKYLPLVIHTGDTWRVVPPNDILRMALTRKGQHTKNSLEIMSLPLSKTSKYECSEDELQSKVVEALLSRNKKVKSFCNMQIDKIAQTTDQMIKEMKFGLEIVLGGLDVAQ